MAFPTETVYGLGASAVSAIAVAKIFEAKQRPSFDPLIVHIPEDSWLDLVVASVPAIGRELTERFWPGPLTLVLPRQPGIPSLVSSGLDTVGVRMPNHELARSLIEQAGVPIAAPSANLFGRTSPTTAQHVLDQLGDRIDYVLDGGPCSVGVESTVVRIVDETIVVLRPGGLTLEELRSVGNVSYSATEGTDSAHVSPGQTLQHYAPLTKLRIRDKPVRTDQESGLRVGLLSNLACSSDDFDAVEVLSSDPAEAATQFFAALRRLDSAGLHCIIATPFADEGLGVALNDRLKRAAAKPLQDATD